jgi:hypothetical protein
MEGLRPNASTSCACRLNASKLYAIHVAKTFLVRKGKKIFDKGSVTAERTTIIFQKKQNWK